MRGNGQRPAWRSFGSKARHAYASPLFRSPPSPLATHTASPPHPRRPPLPPLPPLPPPRPFSAVMVLEAPLDVAPETLPVCYSAVFGAQWPKLMPAQRREAVRLMQVGGWVRNKRGATREGVGYVPCPQHHTLFRRGVASGTCVQRDAHEHASCLLARWKPDSRVLCAQGHAHAHTCTHMHTCLGACVHASTHCKQIRLAMHFTCAGRCPWLTPHPLDPPLPGRWLTPTTPPGSHGGARAAVPLAAGRAGPGAGAGTAARVAGEALSLAPGKPCRAFVPACL